MMNLNNKHYYGFKRLLITDIEAYANSKSLEDLYHDAILRAIANPNIKTKEDLFDYLKSQMIITRFRDNKADALKIPIEYACTEAEEKQAA